MTADPEMGRCNGCGEEGKLRTIARHVVLECEIARTMPLEERIGPGTCYEQAHQATITGTVVSGPDAGSNGMQSAEQEETAPAVFNSEHSEPPAVPDQDNRARAEARAGVLRARLSSMAEHAAEFVRLYAKAVEAEDWKALDYSSIEAWREGEFGQTRFTAEARQQITAMLLEFNPGATVREVAAITGASVGTAQADKAAVFNSEHSEEHQSPKQRGARKREAAKQTRPRTRWPVHQDEFDQLMHMIHQRIGSRAASSLERKAWKDWLSKLAPGASDTADLDSHGTIVATRAAEKPWPLTFTHEPAQTPQEPAAGDTAAPAVFQPPAAAPAYGADQSAREYLREAAAAMRAARKALDEVPDGHRGELGEDVAEVVAAWAQLTGLDDVSEDQHRHMIKLILGS